ncbi:MAG: hypothetical protein J5895_05455 [Alphaproteobacteria bacterium]|nr:hypothetical protein [Alphaproteobacteria bacterium]
MKDKVLASIDLGSNSCRIRIATLEGNLLYKDSKPTKLGEGLFQTKKLSADSMNRALSVFQDFAEKMKAHHVEAYRAIATAACRMAQNGKMFASEVEKQTGIKIEIIDSKEEARLNLKGALLNADKDSEYVVVYDLGGASTEITLAKNNKTGEILHTISIPLGARNASEGYDLQEFQPNKAQKLANDIKAYVQAFIDDSHLKDYQDKCCLIATSSTPLRLCSMVYGDGFYAREKNDGKILKKTDLDQAVQCCCEMSLSERANSPYIGSDRASVFVAAGVIFKSIYDTLDFKQMTVSFKGAQDAILEELRNAEINKVRKACSRSKKFDGSR